MNTIEKNQRITRKEAALILGVSDTTVSNLALRGALSMTRQGQMYYFNRDEVEALIPKTDGVRDIEKSIREVEDILRDEEKRRIGDVRVQRARRDFIERIAGSETAWNRYRDFIMALYDGLSKLGLSEAMSRNERIVVHDAVSFIPITQTALEIGLTRERVRQIYNRALRRIVHFARITMTSYVNAGEEAARMREELASVRRENQRLREELAEWQPRADAPAVRDTPFLATPIRELGLSVRLTNCILGAGIETLGELIKYNRKQVTRFKSLGRKSLDELDTFLLAHGLGYGMRVEEA